MRNLQTGLIVLLAAMLIHLTAGAASGAVTDPANTATVSVTRAYDSLIYTSDDDDD